MVTSYEAITDSAHDTLGEIDSIEVIMLKSVVIDDTAEVAPLIAEVALAMVGLVTEVTDENAVMTDDMVSAAVKIWVMSVVSRE